MEKPRIAGGGQPLAAVPGVGRTTLGDSKHVRVDPWGAPRVVRPSLGPTVDGWPSIGVVGYPCISRSFIFLLKKNGGIFCNFGSIPIRIHMLLQN